MSDLFNNNKEIINYITMNFVFPYFVLIISLYTVYNVQVYIDIGDTNWYLVDRPGVTGADNRPSVGGAVIQTLFSIN